jgi:hypothetical protein
MLGQIIEWLSPKTGTEQPQAPVDTSVHTPSEAVTLFKYRKCTAIDSSTEMATCPRCEGHVETVPTATDRGWTRSHSNRLLIRYGTVVVFSKSQLSGVPVS